MPYIGTGRISLFFEEAGNGGIPLLLLHELGGSSESWREVIRLLATDRRVLAVDMRCAGRSEKPPGAFALADVADDPSNTPAGHRPGRCVAGNPSSGNGTPADDVRGRARHGGTDAGLPGRAGRESAGRGNAWGGGGEPGKLLSGIPPGAAGGLSVP